MTKKQRSALKIMLSAPNVFAIKYFYKRSVKYRILTEDRSPILVSDYRTFRYFIKNEFVIESFIDGIKVYKLTDKAISYKFKNLKNDEKKL